MTDEYTIVTFLKQLADDDLEKQLIDLCSEDLTNDELLERILKIMEELPNDKT